MARGASLKNAPCADALAAALCLRPGHVAKIPPFSPLVGTPRSAKHVPTLIPALFPTFPSASPPPAHTFPRVRRKHWGKRVFGYVGIFPAKMSRFSGNGKTKFPTLGVVWGTVLREFRLGRRKNVAQWKM